MAVNQQAITDFIQLINDEHEQIKELHTGDSIDLIKKEMMEFIHRTCEKRGLKVKYEKKRKGEEEGKQAYSYGNYDFLLNPVLDIDRILISKKKQAEFSEPLSFDANGLVISTNTWKIESISCQNLNHSPKYSSLKKIITSNNMNADNIVMYPVVDGATVSLYWREEYEDEDGESYGSWIFSTANSWEIDNYSWMGKEKYCDILARILKTHKKFSYGKLDKNLVYVMSFHTPSYHPFSSGEGIQLIECFNKTTYERFNSGVDIGIPFQERLDLSDRTHFGASVINDAIDVNSSALSRYLQSIYTETPYIRLGYIIKFNYENGKENSSVLLESDLMKRIRNCIYRMSEPIRYKFRVRSEDREQFIILRAFLDYNNCDVFKRLFPQYIEDFNKYERLFAKVVDGVYDYYKTGTIRPYSVSPSIDANEEDFKADIINELVNKLVLLFQAGEDLSSTDNNSKSIIRDYVVDVRNLPLIWTVISTAWETEEQFLVRHCSYFTYKKTTKNKGKYYKNTFIFSF